MLEKLFADLGLPTSEVLEKLFAVLGLTSSAAAEAGSAASAVSIYHVVIVGPYKYIVKYIQQKQQQQLQQQQNRSAQKLQKVFLTLLR